MNHIYNHIYIVEKILDINKTDAILFKYARKINDMGYEIMNIWDNEIYDACDDIKGISLNFEDKWINVIATKFVVYISVDVKDFTDEEYLQLIKEVKM